MLSNVEKIDFPAEIEAFFTFLFTKNFYLTLVGGGVRDFLLKNILSNDLDFEIRHEEYFEDKIWHKKIRELKKEIEKEFSYSIEMLPFSILRLQIGEYTLELSSPRKEYFPAKEELGHSDFEVKLFSDLSYEESFKRRDFNINAIGLELKKNKRTLVDPYNGQSSLKSKELDICDNDFFKDPVRFLRLIRFSKKLNFDYSKNITVNLDKFNLNKLSSYYYILESSKVGILNFSKEFFQLVNKVNIPIPEIIKNNEFLTQIENNDDFYDPQELCEKLIFNFLSDEKDILYFSDLSSLKIKYIKKLIKFRDLINTLNRDLVCIDKKSLSSLKIESLALKMDFLPLFSIHDHLKRDPDLFKFIDQRFHHLINPDGQLLGQDMAKDFFTRNQVKGDKRKILCVYFHLKNIL